MTDLFFCIGLGFTLKLFIDYLIEVLGIKLQEWIT